MGPFAGILRQVTEHLLEILLFTAEYMIDGDLDRELQIAVDVEACKRAMDRRDGRRDRYASSRHVKGGGGARPGQVVIDLLSHPGNLTSHRGGKLGRAAGGKPIDIVGQDAQRCFKALGQITGLGAASGDYLYDSLNKLVQ